MILHGKHLLKAWTKQQSSVAPAQPKQNCTLATAPPLSRWEFMRLPKTWVEPVPIRLHIDSSCGAVDNKQKQGWAKANDIEIQHLWLQEEVRNNKLTSEKIPSETNSSDLGTKYLTSERSGNVDEARELLILVEYYPGWPRVESVTVDRPPCALLSEVEGE